MTENTAPEYPSDGVPAEDVPQPVDPAAGEEYAPAEAGDDEAVDEHGNDPDDEA